MSGYYEFRFWSPTLGSDALRISLTDDKGSEYFVIIADPGTGKSYRQAKSDALDTLTAAIEQRLPPGQVILAEAS